METLSKILNTTVISVDDGPGVIVLQVVIALLTFLIVVWLARWSERKLSNRLERRNVDAGVIQLIRRLFYILVVVVLVITEIWGEIYSDRTDVGGYSHRQMVLYTCAAAVLSLLVNVDLSHYYSERLRSGDIAIDLFRPVNLFLYGLADHLGSVLYSLVFAVIPFGGVLIMSFLMGWAVAIPTPGGAGSFHAFMKWGLVFLFAIPEGKAVGAGFLMHVVITVPFVLLGVLTLWIEKISWKDMIATARGLRDLGAASGSVPVESPEEEKP